jgi:hypothetical protein
MALTLSVDQNAEKGRLFSNYYRVAFFGKQWRDLQGKEFVYRANDTVRLNDFTTRLKVRRPFPVSLPLLSVLIRGAISHISAGAVHAHTQSQFGSKFGNKVELLGNISVDLAKLKEDVCYFQVVSLTEYFDAVDVTRRPNLWDRKFNLGTALGCSASRARGGSFDDGVARLAVNAAWWVT